MNSSIGEDSDSFIDSAAHLLSLESPSPGHGIYCESDSLEAIKNTAAAFLYGYVKSLIVHKLIDRHKMYQYLQILLEITCTSKISYSISCQLAKCIEQLCTTPYGCADSIASIFSLFNRIHSCGCFKIAE